MYSIIGSCDETSGWHLPGLCSVKETALSVAAPTSPHEDGGNSATMSPAGLNSLRCHKALLHTVDCTTECCQEREFFLVKNVIGSIKAAEHYLPVTLCLSSKRFWLCLHEAPAAETGLSIQCSTAGLSLSSAQRHILRNHNQVLNIVWDVCYVWLILVVTNISQMERKFDIGCSKQVLVSQFICWTKTKLPPYRAVCFEVSALPLETLHACFFLRENHRETHMNMRKP